MYAVCFYSKKKISCLDNYRVEEGSFLQVTGFTSVELGNINKKGGLFYFGNPSNFDRFQVIAKASCSNNFRVRHLLAKDLVDLYAEIYVSAVVTLSPFTHEAEEFNLNEAAACLFRSFQGQTDDDRRNCISHAAGRLNMPSVRL
jgi:hypothetical protein